MPAVDRVVERIHRLGPLSYSAFLEIALYDEADGFYAGAGRPGRNGDFITSPELGPLFGAVIARALDQWWRELGQPDPFVVVEAGAGSGTLAAAVLAARPDCAPTLRYVLVERSAARRDEQATRLAVEPPEVVLGAPAGVDSDEEGESRYLPNQGPRITRLPELPATPVVGVIVANELLDNLAFDLLERSGTGWLEVRVGEREGALCEVLVPAAPTAASDADRLAPAAAAGSRVPLQHAAATWLRSARAALTAGRVAVIDYADETPALARRPWLEWVRTYRGHGRGGHPLDAPGLQDVTCEVAVDQLARVWRPELMRSQADFLADHGIEELVERARADWHAGAAAGGLDALKARSRVNEAAALTDPDGLGAFRVIEWTT